MDERDEVLLVRTDFDGGVNVMALPAAVAVLMLHDGDMGEKVVQRPHCGGRCGYGTLG